MTDERRATARSLPIALLRAREAVMEPIRPILAEAGVTEQQWRVLRVLAEAEAELEPAEIGRRACLLAPSLSRILVSLHSRGLLQRSPDPQDGRRQRVRIEAAGLALIDAVLPRSEAVFAALGERVGERDIERLLDLLAAIAEADRR